MDWSSCARRRLLCVRDALCKLIEIRAVPILKAALLGISDTCHRMADGQVLEAQTPLRRRRAA